MSSEKRILTLPTDSNARKEYPIFSGILKYFPAAIAGAANLSKIGNDKHNPGQPLHHARGKSTDHGDCILRHLMDAEDLLAAESRADVGTSNKEAVLLEASSLVWRALAYAQELHERYGAPLAPAAKIDEVKSQVVTITPIKYCKADNCELCKPHTILPDYSTSLTGYGR